MLQHASVSGGPLKQNIFQGLKGRKWLGTGEGFSTLHWLTFWAQLTFELEILDTFRPSLTIVVIIFDITALIVSV